MARTTLVPELVGNLAGVAEGLSLYNDKLYNAGVFAKLRDADRTLADRVAKNGVLVRRAHSRLAGEQSTEMLVVEGPALVTGLREHLAAVCETERFIQRRRLSEAMNFVSVSTEEYELRLESVSEPVSRLRPAHVLVHRHCAAVGLEYMVKPGDDLYDEQLCRELKQDFDRPLMDARDAFFQDASDAHLERYVATALDLAEQEHPLDSPALVERGFVRRFPEHGKRAEESLETLTVESLMASVLEA